MNRPSSLQSPAVLQRALREPFRWRKPQTVRVGEEAELFDSAVPVEWVDRIFAVMALAPQHTFIVSSGLPERMRAYLTHPNTPVNIGLAALQMVGDDLASNPKSTLGNGIRIKATDINPGALVPWPLPNVWLGVPITNQSDANACIPGLLHTPAALRFVSCEPLLGPVDLKLGWNNDIARWDSKGRELPLRRLDWVLAGGECGRDARPVHPDWLRSLRDQCVAADVPFWFMQWGEWIGGRFDRRKGKMICEPTSNDKSGRIFWTNPGQPKVRLFDEADHYWTNAAARVGKKNAGRLLDGVEHNGSPLDR